MRPGVDAPAVGTGRAWVLAARPKTLTAAVAPVLVGSGLAVHHGVWTPGPALAALVGAGLIQIGTNFANDYYDFVRGSDTEERVGPVRVTQAGLLRPGQVRAGMVASLTAAVVVGSYLVAVGGWPILLIGVVSVACAVLYTGGPFPLAYHGLGDLFVFVFFGLVAVGATVYVQGRIWPADALLAGVALGALSTAILVVNNLRDLDTDEKAGKRTLAVRIGPSATRAQYILLLGVGLAIPVVGWALTNWPPTTLLALLVAPAMVRPARTVVLHSDPRELLPTLGQTARLVAVYGALLGGGLVVG